MVSVEEHRRFMLTYYLMLYSVLYYDYFITLPKEYRRFWQAKWSIVNIAFFFNRYFMILESIFVLTGFSLHWSQDRCEKYFIPWQTFIPVGISAAGGTLLLLRTWAIWGRKRWVLYLLTPMLSIQLGGSIVLAATQVQALPFPEGGPCMTYAPHALMDIYCVMPIIYDFTTSFLCVYKAYKLRKEFADLPSRSPLIDIFLRHGTYYIFGTTAANAINLGFMVTATKHLGMPTVPSNGGLLCTVFSSIFISRLALSLKGDIARNVKPTSGSLPLHSDNSRSNTSKPAFFRKTQGSFSSDKTLVQDLPNSASMHSLDEPRSATPLFKVTDTRDGGTGTSGHHQSMV